SYFKLNPKVNDIPEKYAIEKNGMKLLVMGTINTGGSGCACSINSFIRQLLRHLILENEDVVIMDMEAGIEHLGRGTSDHVDCFCIVTEPNITGLTTARRIVKLSNDVGIKYHIVIGNKILNDTDKNFIRTMENAGEPAYIPFSLRILEMSRNPGKTGKLEPETEEAIKNLVNRLETRIKGNN
ncbi:MAG: hypothetical protein A2161_13175, partial [Candidatus Schekmanbacteria bacterium RBG_13_48_7]